MDNERKHSFYDKWSKNHYEHLTEDELKVMERNPLCKEMCVNP